MYGDTTAIRALAGRLREQGGEIRAEADSLVGRTEAVRWTGLAADSMRGLVHGHAADLRTCATLHAEAADALDRHAREVDRLEELIRSIEHRVLGALDSAGHAFGGLTHAISHVVPDSIEHGVDRFVPPPHGSMDWLAVHVPRVW